MSDEISLKKTFLISVLLHLVLLLVPLHLFMDSAADEARAEQAREEQRDKMTFIFVDTPEDATESEIEQVTPFISDKNLAASNTEAPPELTEGMPYQEGRSEVAAMTPEPVPSTATPGMPDNPKQQQQEREQVSPEQQETGTAADPMRQLEALSRLTPKEKEQQPQPPQPMQQQQPRGRQGRPYMPSAPRFDNRQSRAGVGSDFKLSTYNWNWAPYLKELKKKIESNIYPPPAFYMGLVHGRTFLRFRIHRDGSMTNFVLITYTGHETLKNASVHSIKASFPFIPLPSDFPDEYLEITAGFFYNEFIR